MTAPLTRRSFLAAGAASLALGPRLTAAEKPGKLLMIAGSPSHGPLAHEFNAGVQLLARGLKSVSGLETIVRLNGWPDNEAMFDGVTGVFIYCDGGGRHPAIQGDRLALLGKLMDKGVGLMCAHYAVEVPKDNGGPQFLDWIGGHYEHMYSCNPIWDAAVTPTAGHPITRGVQPFTAKDEWYFTIRFRPEMTGVTPILTATPTDATREGPYVYPKGPYAHVVQNRGRAEPLMWAVERRDGGRGVGFTGGHFHINWGQDDFRKSVLNALVWISGLEVPKDGVVSSVSDAELKQNLDPKPPKK
jgi:hypothetical protein